MSDEDYSYLKEKGKVIYIVNLKGESAFLLTDP